MTNLGKLKEIKDLRRGWPHETLEFTPWLVEVFTKMWTLIIKNSSIG